MEDEVELSVFLGLVDIMFAFAYNRRTTEGDNTVSCFRCILHDVYVPDVQ